MREFAGELLGTAILIIFGNGVVANVVLGKTKGHDAGWIVIAFGWGMAVYVGAFAVSEISGAHLNPAVTLGFAAAENMLFLITPISGGNILASFFTGDVRFIGSTILHVVASAAIGFALAFSDKSRSSIRIAVGVGGLILAGVLHTAFNTLIITLTPKCPVLKFREIPSPPMKALA